MRRTLAFLTLFSALLTIGAQPLSKEALKAEPLFTSIEEAMRNPERVYKLKLKIKSDTLPKEIFQLTNLQELTAARCKLEVVDTLIGDLANLQYLNLSGNRLVSLPESIGRLKHLQSLIISRNIIGGLPESIGELHELTYIDAWDNPLYSLPESIRNISSTLKVIDLRQIDLRDAELDRMEELLPHTDIKFTSTCDCHSTRK